LLAKLRNTRLSILKRDNAVRSVGHGICSEAAKQSRVEAIEVGVGWHGAGGGTRFLTSRGISRPDSKDMGEGC
jgi:hypothetical protein